MGSLDGVYATAAKWRDGLEVVSVLYDPKEIEYQTLVNEAKKFKCTSRVFTYSEEQLKVAKEIVGSKAVMASDKQRPRFASKSDQKYYLFHSPLRSLPMCDYQMTKVNSALGLRQPVESLLSPRQIVLANKILRKARTDQSALEGLESPIDGNKLGEYTVKLEKALAK